MALDGILIYKVLEDLRQDIPLRINQIYGVSEHEYLFQVKPKTKKKQLLISVHPNNNRIQYTNNSYDNSTHPNNFVMLLRKYLNNGVIVGYHQNEMDRYFSIEIESRNDIGDLKTYYWHLELMGRYANLVFTDDQNKIYDAVKRISPLDSPDRPITPGAIYIPPESQHKDNLLTTKTLNTSDSLVKTYSGVSPALAKEIEYRINHNESFEDIQNTIKDSEKLVITTSKKQDFHVLEFKHLEGQSRSFDFGHGFDYLYYQKSLNSRIKNETNDLMKFVNKEVKRLNKRISNLNESMEKSYHADEYRVRGDLLIMHQHQVKKGMTYVNLLNYESNEEITVQLDPKLDGMQNSQKYFKQYRKLTNSVKHINEQMELAEHDLAYFKGLQQQLEIADLEAAKEIRNELIDFGYLRKPRKLSTQKKKKPKYTTINFDESTTIYIGKNNLQNDYLTFKLAAKNHTWLHTQGYHGSHVIINNEHPTEKMLKVAAMFAAYYSQARNSENIPVDYTLVKNIKKIPKAKPGFVKVLEYDTMNITIDLDIINHYLES